MSGATGLAGPQPGWEGGRGGHVGRESDWEPGCLRPPQATGQLWLLLE